jgi:uncharacterized protein with HEPN domain
MKHSYSSDIHIVLKMKKYCDDILACTERFGKSQESFSSDIAYQHACTMCLLQIGELANHLSDDFRGQHSGMRWRQIIDMRNIIAHDYGSIDMELTWTTIANDIPQLKKYCVEILRLEQRTKNRN